MFCGASSWRAGGGQPLPPPAQGELGWVWSRGEQGQSRAPLLTALFHVSRAGLAVPRGYDDTHFTDGGAGESDLLKLPWLPSSSWTNSLPPLLPAASCCLLEATAGSLAGTEGWERASREGRMGARWAGS